MFLRQSTASQSRAIGPFVSDSDFKTVQTGLTIANTDVKILVNGGASANKNSGGGTHRAAGEYGFTFDATDTATVGEFEVVINVSGALVVKKTFFVVEEAVYDALYAASAPGFVAPSAADIADAVWEEDLSDHSGTSGSTAEALEAVGTTGPAEFADALLARHIEGGSDGTRTVSEAFQALRNKTAVAAGTLTVYQSDDATPSWTAAVTTAAGDPITTVDPA